MKKLSDQHIAHILAALRYCQDHAPDFGNMEHFTIQSETGPTMLPLMDDEVNELCEDINCGDIGYVRRDHGSE